MGANPVADDASDQAAGNDTGCNFIILSANYPADDGSGDSPAAGTPLLEKALSVNLAGGKHNQGSCETTCFCDH